MLFSINYSTLNTMLKLFMKLKNGLIEEREIQEVLNHDDYKFEFSRYKNRVSQAEFIDYFLNILDLKEEDINNNDLKIHHKYYKHLLDNLDFYIANEKELDKWLKKETFQEQIDIAMKGLPNDLKLPSLKFIFTIGIGQSFGYVHGNGMHFDFLQLVKEKSLEDFCSTIAHEVHHIGMNLIYDSIDLNSLTLEALFYLYFSGEGLAVKYCNNAEGVLSKPIGNGPINVGLDSFSWEYLNNDFDNTMIQFKKTIRRIRNNDINSKDQLEKHLQGFWMNPLIEGQKVGDIPKLKHFRLYSFGNDIWGVIHDCFGKSAVYEIVKNPQKFPQIFNKALQKSGREDLQI